MAHFYWGIIRKREKLEIEKGNQRDKKRRIENLAIKFGSCKGQPECQICTPKIIRKIEFRIFCGKQTINKLLV